MLDLEPHFAITLFRLKPERSITEYVRFSQEHVRDGMRRFPSVRGFRDYAITDALVSDDGWQLVELIAVSSPEDFLRDNEGAVGQRLAQEWETWVESYRVLFIRDLLPEEPTD
jgi:hypothetical protein